MLNVKRSVPLSLLLLLLLLSPCRAWEGKVVDVADGDGITVLHDGQDERIRLYGVDTPESRQDFGRKARSFTSDMVFGKTVEVKAFDTDRYGRTVAMVYVDGGKCLNEELLRAGLAWLYERFCNRPHCREWKQIELTAREGKVGLWADPNPVPPWEFRYSGGKQTPTGEGTPAAISAPTGDGRPATTITVTGGGRPSLPSTEKGPFHGDTVSRVFHKPDCPQYNCKTCTPDFKTRDEAIRAGYKPCGMCNP